MSQQQQQPKPDRAAEIRKMVADTPQSLRSATSLEEAFERSPILFQNTSDVPALADPSRVALSGIGLSWSKYSKETETLESGLTSGLPIDVMSYLAVIGQRHKYAPDAPKTIFLVSDYFAKGLPGITDEDLKAKTDEQIEKLTNVASQLRITGTGKTLLQCLDIRRVSEDVAANQESFDTHYNNLAHHENDYVRRQTAAIAMYREITGASVKISYAFEDAAQSNGYDERKFDIDSRNYDPTNDMSFVYVDVGRATDTSAAKACPYITNTDLQNRRLMMGDTDFAEKIQACEDRVAAKTGRSGNNARKRLPDIKTYIAGLADLVDSTFSVVEDADVLTLPNMTGNAVNAVRNLERVGQLVSRPK